MNKLLFSLLLIMNLSSFAQPASYSVANAHSHNDYEQPVPLFAAYNEGFGSIEADIFWHNGELLVAHTPKELALHRTLEELYLKPLQVFVEKNKGHIYADSLRRLQLMIDIKSEAIATLNKLVELLQKYATLIQCASLQIAISGNRPDAKTYSSYPAFIKFDGELHKEYPADALSRIVMMSADLKKYTLWNGNGTIPAPQWETLQQAVSRAHSLGKPVRFWGSPDVPNAWSQLVRLRVDYINTDSIKAVAGFLNKLKR